MKMFHFSMQRLLDAREAQQKAVEMKLAEQLRLQEDCRSRLQALHATRAVEVADIVRKQKMSLEGWEMGSRIRYLQMLDTKITFHQELLKESDARVAKVREKLALAIQEKKVLENLKDKERKTWALEYNHQEQKHLDEVASTAFVRKSYAV